MSLSRGGVELLFRIFADRYERGSLLITTNLPFGEWNQIFQGERMTAALSGPSHPPLPHFRDEWRELSLSRVDEEQEEPKVGVNRILPFLPRTAIFRSEVGQNYALTGGQIYALSTSYLAERLVEAWEDAEKRHTGVPGITPEGTASTGAANEQLIPKDTDERLAFARRIVAQRCLYGVDKNPLAVEMAKLSLWLLTLAKDKPFTFLDHAIRRGDSLVGVRREQLKTFSLDGKGSGSRCRTSST